MSLEPDAGRVPGGDKERCDDGDGHEEARAAVVGVSLSHDVEHGWPAARGGVQGRQERWAGVVVRLVGLWSLPTPTCLDGGRGWEEEDRRAQVKVSGARCCRRQRSGARSEKLRTEAAWRGRRVEEGGRGHVVRKRKVGRFHAGSPQAIQYRIQFRSPE